MKIFISGSSRTLPREQVRPFEDACRLMGARLTAEGHEFTVGSDAPHTADFHIVAGVASLRVPTTIHAIHPSDPQGETLPVFSGFQQQLGLSFRIVEITGRWSTIRQPALQEADVVLLIGGAVRTREAAATALTLGVPVLPIATFGSAAREILDAPGFDRTPLTPAEWYFIERHWISEFSPCVVSKAVGVLQNSRRPHPKRPWPRYQGNFASLFASGLGKVVDGGLAAVGASFVPPSLKPWVVGWIERPDRN